MFLACDVSSTRCRSSGLWWLRVNETLNCRCNIKGCREREKEKLYGKKEMLKLRVETVNFCVTRIQWTFLSHSFTSLSISLENWRKLTHMNFPTERARKKYHISIHWLSYNIVKKVRVECLQVRETAGRQEKKKEKNFISLIENNSIFKSMGKSFAIHCVVWRTVSES